MWDATPEITRAVTIKERDKSARELEAKAADIDAAVFDLKAVNPNTLAKVDTRTSRQIIANIDRQGRIVSASLAKLSRLLEQA
ncbi:MAG: type I restriction enzyme M protein [Candidatus Kentron sp. G]|nr:MAG: type I restriction enzyme M protein [Candidatus Kentron sp. G]VFN01951.1 MAG: type I restriction enzyme M protein [Candidatus Kentron sp. G]VFN03611.1 MAG: type I restriction enzyme M protein [Candidatus Kentron sp. G]